MIIEKFTTNGKDYEIQVNFYEQELKIKAFYDGQPVNGYSYQVKLDKVYDLKILAEKEEVKELVNIAKNDVIERRYEKLIQSLKEA